MESAAWKVTNVEEIKTGARKRCCIEGSASRESSGHERRLHEADSSPPVNVLSSEGMESCGYLATPSALCSCRASDVFSPTEYPSVLEIAIAAFFAAAAIAGTRSRVTRVVGPETLKAAAILPEASKIGAPMQRDPR